MASSRRPAEQGQAGPGVGRQVAAVDRKQDAGHHRCGIRREEDHGTPDLTGCSEATEGDAGQDPVHERLMRTIGCDLGPPGVGELARQDRVDPYVLWRPGKGHFARKLADSALGHGVSHIPAAQSANAGDRAEVHDAAAAPRRYHPGRRRAGAQEETGEVAGQGSLPVVQGEQFRRGTWHRGRNGVDEDVDTTKGIRHFPEDPLHLGLVGEIRDDADGGTATVLDLLSDLGDPDFIEVDDGD